MPHLSDDAIVLRRSDYAETSQVLVLFTRSYGKVHTIAKGVRRSTRQCFRPGIDLLEYGRVNVSVRQPGQQAMAILTDWKTTRGKEGLHERLDRLQAGQYVADATVRLTEDWDPHPLLFEHLANALLELGRTEHVLSVVTTFQRVLFDEIGMLPQFDACIGCGRSMRGERKVHFSSFEGGLVCRDCEPAHVEKRALRVPVEVLAGDRPSAGDIESAGVFDVFHYHVSHVMGKEPAGSGELTRMATRLSRR